MLLPISHQLFVSAHYTCAQKSKDTLTASEKYLLSVFPYGFLSCYSILYSILDSTLLSNKVAKSCLLMPAQTWPCNDLKKDLWSPRDGLEVIVGTTAVAFCVTSQKLIADAVLTWETDKGGRWVLCRCWTAATPGATAMHHSGFKWKSSGLG